MSTRSRLDYSRQGGCWQDRSDPIILFWIDGQWLLFPFFSFLGGAHMPEEEAVSLSFTAGTVLVTGPKAGDFCSAFCQHRATLLKADGKEIVSVRYQSRAKEAASE